MMHLHTPSRGCMETPPDPYLPGMEEAAAGEPSARARQHGASKRARQPQVRQIALPPSQQLLWKRPALHVRHLRTHAKRTLSLLRATTMAENSKGCRHNAAVCVSGIVPARRVRTPWWPDDPRPERAPSGWLAVDLDGSLMVGVKANIIVALCPWSCREMAISQWAVGDCAGTKYPLLPHVITDCYASPARARARHLCCLSRPPARAPRVYYS